MVIQMLSPQQWFSNQVNFCDPSLLDKHFRLPNSVSMSNYGDLDQSATVTASTTDQTIFTFNVPGGMRLFIYEWANTIYSGTSLKIFVDGELYERSAITRKLGEIKNPTKLPLPIYAYKKLEVKASNTGSTSLCMEFYANGVLYDYGQFRQQVLRKVKLPPKNLPPQSTDDDGCPGDGLIPEMQNGESNLGIMLRVQTLEEVERKGNFKGVWNDENHYGDEQW